MKSSGFNDHKIFAKASWGIWYIRKAMFEMNYMTQDTSHGN